MRVTTEESTVNRRHTCIEILVAQCKGGIVVVSKKRYKNTDSVSGDLIGLEVTENYIYMNVQYTLYLFLCSLRSKPILLYAALGYFMIP